MQLFLFNIKQIIFIPFSSCSFLIYCICCICYGLLFPTVVVVLPPEGNVIYLILLALEEKVHLFFFVLFFCTVKVLFTLGALSIQLFNKVFDFISSIGTHGIYICVV